MNIRSNNNKMTFYTRIEELEATVVQLQSYCEQMNMMMANMQEQASVNNLVLEAFWETNPIGWYSMVESKFRLSMIYDEQSRYDLVISNLTFNAFKSIGDILRGGFQRGDYDRIKRRLIKSCDEEEKMKKAKSSTSKKPTNKAKKWLQKHVITLLYF